MQIEQLPQSLQDEIREHTGGNRIEDIDRQTREGQTTYQVAFKRDGEHTELLFNERGQLVTASGAPALTSGKVEYSELPPAVQQMVDTRVQKGEINDIDRQVKNGNVTYEVGFKQNGEQQELLLSQDGRILRDVSLGAAAQAATRRATSVMLSPRKVELSNARKVVIDQLPEKARTVVESKTAGSRIEDLEVGTWNGRQVYEAAFKEDGKHIELQVAANGQVVFDPRFTQRPVAAPTARPVTPTGRAAAVGRPGGPFSGSGQLPADNLVPMTAPQRISTDALPQEVQQALQRRVPNGEFDEIRRGVWENRVVYQIQFEQNGRDQFLQLDQTGRLIHDTREPVRR